MDTLGPRQSAELISKVSKHVHIHQSGIESLAMNLINLIKADRHSIHMKGWKTHQLHPAEANQSAIDWIFLVDALNFSFWSVSPTKKFMVDYAGETYTGYWTLCAAVNRALDEGIPITSAEYCKNFTIEKARHVFRSNSTTEMPMLEERVKVMQEIGQVLLEKFDGSFSNCIAKANGEARKLLQLVTENFSCFRDEGVFNGRKVSFYKRAQILVADLWACFEGEGLGRFDDIDSITMFADYRIPQLLVYFNVLSYSEELDELLKKEHMFSNGDEIEMEIRGASIWAVELLAKSMNKIIQDDTELKGVHINSILLDHFLWDYRREHNVETQHVPFHRVRCIYY
ncbi:C9orf64 [Bugula neritina]|uniref:Queuosine 5'-phosphate N-glycosylase/hydrolase n=1 Tax=Bugula neritina TaxID=10212 RepID=A0A7J7JHR5_BUGNE|nr:C9orf64 [Bugula neritina]